MGHPTQIQQHPTQIQQVEPTQLHQHFSRENETEAVRNLVHEDRVVHG